MDNLFYTPEQFDVFSKHLLKTFINSGFELIEEPYVDYALYGFRATYMRRYLLHKPVDDYDGILTTLVHVVGLPFGHQSHKMVIISAPRSILNEPISDTIRLRVHFDRENMPFVVHGDRACNNPTPYQESAAKTGYEQRENPFHAFSGNPSNQQQHEEGTSDRHSDKSRRFSDDLVKYVAHLIEIISPGLIGLPNEMKLEILKKLNLESIIRMSQVNNEFRCLIFRQGESLWRHLCLRDFNIRSINRILHKTWMELYRDSYITQQIEICRKERALPGLPERPALPPVPYRLQIGWLPELMAEPFYPDVVALPPPEVNPPMFNLDLAIHPLRRADSLDSLN